MIVRFRRGNMTETRPVHGKLDHHVSACRKRDGYKQLPVSVEFTKYGNRLFRPVKHDVVTTAKCAKGYDFMQTYLPKCLNSEGFEGYIFNGLLNLLFN